MLSTAPTTEGDKLELSVKMLLIEQVPGATAVASK